MPRVPSNRHVRHEGGGVERPARTSPDARPGDEAAGVAWTGRPDRGEPVRSARGDANVFRDEPYSLVESMKRQDILRRLEERLARGEISEKTYLEIKARYESEPEEPEEPEPTMADLGSTIGAAVAQATQDAGHAAEEAVRAVGEAMRAVEFSGIGARLSDET